MEKNTPSSYRVYVFLPVTSKDSRHLLPLLSLMGHTMYWAGANSRCCTEKFNSLKDECEMSADLPAISRQIMHMEKATTMIIGNWKRKQKPPCKMLIKDCKISCLLSLKDNRTLLYLIYKIPFFQQNIIRVLIITAQIFKQVRRAEESGGRSPRCLLRL